MAAAPLTESPSSPMAQGYGTRWLATRACALSVLFAGPFTSARPLRPPGPLSAAAILASALERIRHHLVGLRMPKALETLDHTVRRLEQSEVSALEALEVLLGEELSLRETRRITMAQLTARLSTVKTLAGFDFACCITRW